MKLLRWLLRTALASVWLVGAAASAADTETSPLRGYSFCESVGDDTHAYVTPVFKEASANMREGFGNYLTARYRLQAPEARCFTLPSLNEARQFRTQRIEILHWDGRRHVVATRWTPAQAQSDSSRTDTDKVAGS